MHGCVCVSQGLPCTRGHHVGCDVSTCCCSWVPQWDIAVWACLCSLSLGAVLCCLHQKHRSFTVSGRQPEEWRGRTRTHACAPTQPHTVTPTQSPVSRTHTPTRLGGMMQMLLQQQNFSTIKRQNNQSSTSSGGIRTIHDETRFFEHKQDNYRRIVEDNINGEC